MDNSDLSADISFERLPPACSVPSTPERAPDKDAESKPRRRPPPDEGAGDEEGANDAPLKSDDDDEPKHQIDSLA